MSRTPSSPPPPPGFRPFVLFGFAIFNRDGRIQVWQADDAGITQHCTDFPAGIVGWIRAFWWVIRHRKQDGC